MRRRKTISRIVVPCTECGADTYEELEYIDQALCDRCMEGFDSWSDYDVSKWQALAKAYSADPATGRIGYKSWLALGRPEGWLVWTNGSWWTTEELNEMSEEVNRQQ